MNVEAQALTDKEAEVSLLSLLCFSLLLLLSDDVC